MYCWIVLSALLGGCAPQSSSARRSVETTSFGRVSSRASSARWRPPPRGTERSPCTTSRGPRIRNSISQRVLSGVSVLQRIFARSDSTDHDAGGNDEHSDLHQVRYHDHRR